ncbi:MAG: DEAD/DEAH box helicase family protein [Candidatus Lokiarchaeota archaeon]|nr:DEAD/DEAH box helicase family protein [Candidatus Harpocratesius repetitus]
MSDKKTIKINQQLLNTDLIDQREYQLNIAQTASYKNTLVVLPTSLGKTIIAVLSIAHTLESAPHSKILFLAPTRPLVQQHYDTFHRFFKSNVRLCIFSSGLSPTKRALSLNEADIFFSTPQIIKNDLEAGLYSLEGFGHIIFDEVHKARKRYSYTYVAEVYLSQCSCPLILGLTASPGKDLFRINELCQNLQIEQIVFRNQNSLDVRDYVFPINTIIQRIELPNEILKAQMILDTAIRKILEYLHEQDILPRRRFSSKFQFIQLIQDLKMVDILCDSHMTEDEKQDMLQKQGFRGLNFPHLAELFDVSQSREIPNKATAMGYAINGIYLEHLKEILTTQDVRMFWTYLQKLQDRADYGNKHLKRFLHSKYINGVKQILRSCNKSPKMDPLIRIIQDELAQDPKAKLIVFTQYREMGTYIEEELNRNFAILFSEKIAYRFVGQASRLNDPGLSQNDQKKLLNHFSNGKYRILIATSVAEEGLDIPNVNAVIFYDSVPSEIRLIQRRGRTGRHTVGKCYCLVSPNTLDEIYYQVSHYKEEKMQSLLTYPEKIQTIEEFPRTIEKPKYSVQTLSQIEKNRQKYKENQELVKINQIIEKVNVNYSQKKELTKRNKKQNGKKKAYNLISDITKELTSLGKNRILQNKHHTSENNSTHTLLSKYGITKKYYDWILSTMELSGELKGNCLYFELDALYSEARNEEIDSIKIEITIDRCLKAGIFQTAGAYLTYVYG